MIKPLAALMASDISLDPNQARLIALSVLVKFRLYPGIFCSDLLQVISSPKQNSERKREDQVKSCI
jgi:hypothetical protein